MINVLEKKEKIITFLRQNGPTLPVTISKVIEMDPFFASAILSEVLGEKRIRASHMRVGSSPLYFLEGQENMLEKMSSSLKSVEREAFERLREKKVLVDSAETPAIRVALRGIKDFAVPFKLDEQIMWRYAFFSEDEVRKMLLPKQEEIRKEILKEDVEKFENYFIYKYSGRDKNEIYETLRHLEKEHGKGFVYNRDLKEEGESREEIIRKVREKIKDFAKTNPKMKFIVDYQHGLGRLMNVELEEARRYGFEIIELNKTIKEPKEKKKERKIEKKTLDIFPEERREKSEFFNEVKEFLEKKKIEFLEEIQSDKKEVVAKIRVDSDVGKIDFLLIAKNKSGITKEEIDMAVQRATHGKAPCLILIRKKPTKTIENFVLNNNLVKIEAMG